MCSLLRNRIQPSYLQCRHVISEKHAVIGKTKLVGRIRLRWPKLCSNPMEHGRWFGFVKQCTSSPGTSSSGRPEVSPLKTLGSSQSYVVWCWPACSKKITARVDRIWCERAKPHDYCAGSRSLMQCIVSCPLTIQTNSIKKCRSSNILSADVCSGLWMASTAEAAAHCAWGA